MNTISSTKQLIIFGLKASCIKLLFVFLCINLSPSVTISQNNSITGKVVFPVVKKKLNVKRGTNYRNRLNKNKTEETQDDGQSLVVNTVISALPLGTQVRLVPQEVDLIQKNKTFHPHVLPITKGSTVRFINEDEFYHNVFSLSPGSKFNIGRRKPGKVVARTFEKKGVVKIFCDIHPQMSAQLITLATPYFAKVNADGSYWIGGIPDGDYELQFYNPSIEYPNQKIKVEGGNIYTYNFDLSSESFGSRIESEKPQRWYVSTCCSQSMCSNSE